MAHPKRRQSRHRQGIRRANVSLKTTVPNHCARCGATIRPHRVCDNCGHYGFEKGGEKRGTEVFEKEDF